MGLQSRRFAILSAVVSVLILGCDDETIVSPPNRGSAGNSSQEEMAKPLAHTHGSFVLTYEMKIAGGRDTDEEIDKAVLAIERRIDPQGVAGLKFRNLGGGRLEVRGPMPPPEVLSLREAHVSSVDHLMAKDVSRAEIERFLYKRTKNERRAGMAALIDRHPSLTEEIRAVFDSFESHNRNRGPYPDIEAVMERLRPRGVLEFRIAPTPVQDMESYQDGLQKNGPDTAPDEPYIWHEIDDIGNMLYEAGDRQLLEADATAFLSRQGIVGARHKDKYYLLLSNQIKERLSDADAQWRVESARLSRDHAGFLAVEFALDSTGAALLGDMTQRHPGRMLAIVLDGKAIMIATIQSRIDRKALISCAGGFSAPDARRIVGLLNAGALKARLSPSPSSIKIIPAE